MSDRDVADDVLAHSEDEGEWENEPVVLERRSTGTQVLSARLPRELAHRVFAAAEERRTRPSDVLREALESYFAKDHHVLEASATAQPGPRVRLFGPPLRGYETQNPTDIVVSAFDGSPLSLVSLHTDPATS